LEIKRVALSENRRWGEILEKNKKAEIEQVNNLCLFDDVSINKYLCNK